MSCNVQFDPAITCDRCGCFGAYAFDTAQLCADCYETRGSCCPEFGGDDMWEQKAASPAAANAPDSAADKAQTRFPPGHENGR
jgi:hypothetical protein